MKKRSIQVRVLAVLLAVAFGVGETLAAIHGPELPNPGDTGISKQQQEQIGLQAVSEVYKQMPVLSDSSPETQYVQQLGRKLMRVIPQQYTWPYQFHVIPQKEINAFALPGGPVFVNIGTITAAQNEAELAGVMAHEMSHVYMQHSIKQMQKQQKEQLFAGVLGAVLGRMGGAVGALGQMGVGLGAGLLSLKYSRADEAQADEVGAIIMYKAGYDPRYLAKFFQRLAAEGSGGPQFLSDHPNPGNREEAIDKEIADWPPKNFQVNSDQFVQAKQQAQGVHAYSAQEIANGAKSGEWARQNQQSGAMPRNLPVSQSQGAGTPADIAAVPYSQVAPSSSLAQTQNSVFSIGYPNNWQVYSGRSQITVGPPAGVAQGAVAYGVIVSGTQDNSSLDQATQDLIRSLEQSNQGLRANGAPQPIRVNGLAGRSVDLIGESPIQQNGRPIPERDWLVTVARPSGGMLYLVFISPERDFNRLRPTYENMLRSLRTR